MAKAVTASVLQAEPRRMRVPATLLSQKPERQRWYRQSYAGCRRPLPFEQKAGRIRWEQAETTLMRVPARGKNPQAIRT